MYLFFMALGLNDFDGGKSISRPLEGVGPEDFDLFGPKWLLLRPLPFQGPPLPMALEIGFSRIKIILSRAI
jgi:hypothetical protein